MNVKGMRMSTARRTLAIPDSERQKLSYYPDILLPKYELEESGVVYADPESGMRRIFRKSGRNALATTGRLYSVLSEAPNDEREYARDFPGWKTGIDGKFSAGAVPVQRSVCGRALCVRLRHCRNTGDRSLRNRFCALQKKNIVPLILSPAEESLIRYYENLGFKNAFRENARTWAAVTLRRSGKGHGAGCMHGACHTGGVCTDPG